MRYPNKPKRRDAVGIGVLDDPRINGTNKRYLNKPKRRYVVGAIHESPENERYNQPHPNKPKRRFKPNLPLRYVSLAV